jgi:hypothetical protein
MVCQRPRQKVRFAWLDASIYRTSQRFWNQNLKYKVHQMPGINRFDLALYVT